MIIIRTIVLAWLLIRYYYICDQGH